MKLYDKVELLKDYKKYKAGTKGIIVEIFEDRACYLEILDKDGDTIDMAFDVPLKIIKKIK